MSHVAKMALQFTELDLLKATVEQIPGVRFNEGKTTHRYYSGKKACEHEIEVEGLNYSIGVVKHSSGEGYDLALDDFGSSKGGHDGRLLVQHFGGQGLPAVRQGYQQQAAMRQLRKDGWRVFTQRQENGQIKLRATK